MADTSDVNLSPPKNGNVECNNEESTNDNEANNKKKLKRDNETETSIKVTEHIDSCVGDNVSASATESFDTPKSYPILTNAKGFMLPCSPFHNVVKTPKFFTMRPNESRSPAFQKPVLRPSLLTNSGLIRSPSKSSPFVLNPSKLSSQFDGPENSADSSRPRGIFTSNEDSTEKGDPEDDTSDTKSQDTATPPAAGQLRAQQSDSSTECETSEKIHTASVGSVRLLSSTPTGASSSSIRFSSCGSNSFTADSGSGSAPGGFVFGQNLHERVIIEQPKSEASTSKKICDIKVSSPATDGSSTSENKPVASTNGTSSEMLFSSVIQKKLPEKTQEGHTSTEDKTRKSLSESAREYEESRAVKRKYEEVAVITGEEEENNILQMDCKLFVYDGSKLNYSEGVHGSLRVNDPPMNLKTVTQSRVIVRMSGTLRVLMNTKIWAGMKIEKPNRKIVRMTAMDSVGQIKVFLISSSPSESDMLYRVLETRIKLQNELTGTGSYRNGSIDETIKPTGN